MYNVAKPYNRKIIFDGNSLGVMSEGNLQAGMRYPQTCYSLLIAGGYRVAYHNYSIGGKTTQDDTSEFFTKFATENLSKNDIVVFWEICNDAHNLTSDTNGTALYANVIAYCNQARTAGAKVVVVTGIPRDMTSYDDATITTRIFNCNALIRANWATFADALADVALLTQFDAKADTLDTTYYNADKCHLTNAGYDLIAGVVKTAIQTLL